MDERIRKELYEGEQLLYTGRPLPTELLDKTNKTAVIIKNVLATVISLALIIGYALYSANSRNGAKAGLYIVLAMIAVISIYSSISDVSMLNKKMFYALSNRRLFVAIGDNVKSVEFEKIPCVVTAKDDDGRENFLFGKNAAKLKPSAWRKACVVGHLVDSQSELCDEFVMLYPENGDKVKEIIKTYLTVM